LKLVFETNVEIHTETGMAGLHKEQKYFVNIKGDFTYIAVTEIMQ